MIGTSRDRSPVSSIRDAVVCGVGIDAVDVERFRRVMVRRPRLAERVFTGAERTDAARAKDPAPRLAARFAAKEAVMKALGVGLGAVGLKEVEVVRSDSGEPRLVLSGRAADLAVDRGIERWLVSLTHTEIVAFASVLAVGPAQGVTR